VASAVSATAGAVLGHSLERGKTAAMKARPALEAFQAERHHAHEHAPPGALESTVILDGGTPGAVAPDAETVPLPSVDARGAASAGAGKRRWRHRLSGRKPLIAMTAASFIIGTGAVTAFTLARDGSIPGDRGGVFTPDDGRGSSHDPRQQSPGTGGGHTTGKSQHTQSPTPTGSGSGSTTPTPPTTPTTTSSSDSSSSSSDSPTPPATPTTGPTTSPSSPMTGEPTAGPASGASTGATTPSGQGAATPGAAATSAGNA